MLINTMALYALLSIYIALASSVSHHKGKASTLSSLQKYICRAGDYNNGTLYGTVSQDRAIGYIREAKTKKGRSGYPKKFNNNGNIMKFPKGCSRDIWELPLLPNGKPYHFTNKKSYSNPEYIRVYYTKNLKFCGIGAKRVRSTTIRNNFPHNCQLQ
ncbi:unnamed protein product [Clonostachys solani]|uniref:Uncharacterized protein n=1 Tax=Clonostachys solani TaxID=160281 RepID=A0A9N9ZIQ8_9HYPO|nr:unnamed protein product [Clonostachys solani]